MVFMTYITLHRVPALSGILLRDGIYLPGGRQAGLVGEELSHLDVQAVADRRAQEFERLVTRSIEKMCEDERSE